MYGADGQSAKADNAIDAALLWLSPLIKRDPNLVHQLETTRPELQTGLELAKSYPMSMSFGGRPTTSNTKPSRRPDSNMELRGDAIRLSHMNPDVAIAKAEQLPSGPERTKTLLEVARNIAGDHPEQAKTLIAEATSGGQAEDETQVSVLSARAFVAAAQGNQSELHDLLQQGLQMASQHVSGPERNFVGGTLVQIGIQNEPDLTVAFLQSLPASHLKAQLLLEAASALNMRSKLPLSSRPQPNPARVH